MWHVIPEMKSESRLPPAEVFHYDIGSEGSSDNEDDEVSLDIPPFPVLLKEAGEKNPVAKDPETNDVHDEVFQARALADYVAKDPYDPADTVADPVADLVERAISECTMWFTVLRSAGAQCLLDQQLLAETNDPDYVAGYTPEEDELDAFTDEAMTHFGLLGIAEHLDAALASIGS